MPGFWRRTGLFSGYKSTKQVNRREFGPLPSGQNSSVHIICDIDKTYLETKFETVLQLIQTAFQNPESKQTVLGATDVLKAARWGSNHPSEPGDFPRGLHFVSSSPPQMRATLETKLSADGLDWDSDSFKDQAYNIIKGKVALLRNHAAYKTLAIFRILRTAKQSSRIFLIGDNAEIDPYIYAGIMHYLNGSFSAQQYLEYVKYSLPEDLSVDEIREGLTPRPNCTVEEILIRKAPGYESVLSSPLTDRITYFDDYFQAALILSAHQLIPAKLLRTLIFRFHNMNAMPLAKIRVDLAKFITLEKLDPELRDAAQNCADEIDQLKLTSPALQKASTFAWQQSAHDARFDSTELLKSAKKWLHEREKYREQKN
jgi:hypothetical protein